MGRTRKFYDGDKKFNERAFGRKIQEIRKYELRMTAEMFSKEIGVSAAYERQLECGCKTPSMELFIEICKRLKTTPSYLLSDSINLTEKDDALDENMLAMRIAALSRNERKMLNGIILTLDNSEEGHKTKEFIGLTEESIHP